MPVIDVLDYIIPPLDFRSKNCLTSADGTRKKWTVLSDPDKYGIRHLYYVKNAAGDTFDLLAVPNTNDPTQEAWICERATENGYGNPTGGKVNFYLGQPRFKRFLNVPDAPILGTPQSVQVAMPLGGGLNDPNTATASSTTAIGPPYFWTWKVDRPVTDYAVIPAGPLTKQADITSDAGVRCTYSGPYAGAATGDLPAGEDWMLEYERNYDPTLKVYKAMERNFYRKGFGWWAWYSFVTDPANPGSYIPHPTETPSLLVKIVATPPPQPVKGYA